MGQLQPGGFGAKTALDERKSWVSGASTDARGLEWMNQRRSFGTVAWTGENEGYDCQNKAKSSLSFGTGDVSALQRADGRYVPRPYLTSITTKNQGNGDISDIAMWDISFEWVVYSRADFNTYSTAFMIPGNIINVSFGWNNQFGSVKIDRAAIYNFGWTYNLDGSFTCNASALAKTAVAGGFIVGPGRGLVKSTQTTEDGETSTSYSIIRKLQKQVDTALGVGRDADGKVTIAGGLPNGTARSVGNFGIVKIEKEAGFFASNFTDANEMLISFVTVGEIAQFFNNNILNGLASIDVSTATFKDSFLFKSADPVKIILPGRGADYTGFGSTNNNFTGLLGNANTVRDIFVSTNLLMDIEKELLDRKKEGEEASFTVHQFMGQLFKEIETETGGIINCFLQSDPQQTEEIKRYFVINRHNDIKQADAAYTFTTLSPTSILKGLSMSSNLDAEMSAIAFTGGGGKFPSNAISNVFKCKPKAQKGTQLSSDNNAAGTSKPSDNPNNTNIILKNKIKEMGDAYNSENVSDFRSVLRKHFMTSEFPKGLAIPYSINLSVTIDGVDGIQFFNTFTIDNLPAGFGDVFFAVGEIEHSVSDGNWDTTIVGYMMIRT